MLTGFKLGKHTRGDSSGRKAERANIRLVPKGHFERVDRVAELVERLFHVERKKY